MTNPKLEKLINDEAEQFSLKEWPMNEEDEGLYCLQEEYPRDFRSRAFRDFKTGMVRMAEIKDAEIQKRDEMIAKLEKALEHCRDFDTSGSLGQYEYGEIVRGQEPGVGQRWMTPKESARSAIADLKKWRDENG